MHHLKFLSHLVLIILLYKTRTNLKKPLMFHKLLKEEIRHRSRFVMVMGLTSLSQLESDPHSTELWDLTNTLGLLKPNRIPVNLNPK